MNMDFLVGLQDARVAKTFYDIKKYKAINFHHLEGNKVDAEFLFGNMPYEFGRLMLQDCATRGMAHTIELYMMANIAHDSPRVYQAKQLDCEAMSQMALKIPVEDFHQPFPTMIIELPKDYYTTKVVPNASINEMFKEIEHFPKYACVHYDLREKILMLACHFSSGQVVSKIFWKIENHETVEDALGEAASDIFKDSMTMNKMEWEVSLEAMRIGLNCSYLLHHYGCEKLGPKNPSYFQRLLHYIDVAKKSKDKIRIEKAELQVAVVPQYYDFKERERKLFNKSFNKTDRTVRTHWRQGHIARQRFGKNWENVRTIVRLPTIVNPPERK